jgi:hypothetical protein
LRNACQASTVYSEFSDKGERAGGGRCHVSVSDIWMMSYRSFDRVTLLASSFTIVTQVSCPGDP